MLFSSNGGAACGQRPRQEPSAQGVSPAQAVLEEEAAVQRCPARRGHDVSSVGPILEGCLWVQRALEQDEPQVQAEQMREPQALRQVKP